MTRLWRYCLALVSAGFFLLPVCCANQFPRVDSARTTAQLHDGALRIVLGIDSPSAQPLPAQITLELLDPNGNSRGQAQRQESIRRGSSKSYWSIQLSGVKSANLDDVLWYRLRYRIEPNPSADSSFEPVSGILSVSEIAPAMFRLEYAGPSVVRPNARFEVLIRAVQPATLVPVAGVTIRATADVSDTGAITPITASGMTDPQGYARLEFLLPKNADTDRPSIDILGERDGYTAKLEDEQPSMFPPLTFRVNTDKPLYQPGQTLHARVLAVDGDEHAAPNHPLDFRIYDSDNTLVFRGTATTSKFGIASADWPIPSNERLGDYRVAVKTGDMDAEDFGGSVAVKISRYDLPTFTVNAKPDRKYYLSGQNATVNVSAEYLFGKPVASGHVRVTRDDEREWNYQAQKWDVRPGKVYEGDTDSTGSFVADIDLSSDHKALADNDYLRLQDISYAAYFTDSTTGRTEHRRFDLRLTKDRIHIYVMPLGQSATKHTVDFYLSTYYADGTPASCVVAIRTSLTTTRSGETKSVPVLRRTIRTNSYGIAKVLELPVSPKDNDNDQLVVSLEARDKTGASGKHTQDFWLYDSNRIRVETDKALYRAGDPIQVNLTSDDENATVEVSADSQWRFITSQMVHLHRGKAAITLDPSDQFEGPITIYAYELGRRSATYSDDRHAQGSHAVLFPHDSSLKIGVRMSKITYRPGEEAEAEFHVDSADGAGAQAALGIVAVDKAVEERERSDADLQNPWRYVAFSTDWSDDSSLSGVSRADLDKVDLSKPLSPGFDLLAEMLLQGYADGGQFDDSGSGPDLRKLFSSSIEPAMGPVLAILRTQIHKDSNPEGESGIRKLLATTNIGSLRDPWGTAYGVTVEPSGTNYRVSITSAGPDQKMGTADDFEVASDNLPYFGSYAAMIDKAVENYHARTGSYIRDAKVLKSELLPLGVDLDSLRDPWQHPYRVEFGIERNFYTVEVRSGGPDGIFSPANTPSDDVVESRNVIEYFEDTRAKIDAALQHYYQDEGVFPQDQQAFTVALRRAGIDWESLRDPWGHQYYATFFTEAAYSDNVVVESYSEYAAGQHTAIHPVTTSINYIEIRSSGPDGKKGTTDDFEAATFSRAIYAQTTGQSGGPKNEVVFSGELGAISGTITDQSGGVIAAANVTATRYETGEIYRVKSDDQGHFLLRNLKPGAYEVRVARVGFRDDAFTQVPVGSSVVTQLSAVMQVASSSEKVEVVESAAPLVQTTASVAAVARPNGTGKSRSTVTQIAPLSTPRLREYFPETLLWRPEVITTKRGTAEIKFPLADSITTWDLTAIASTVDGRTGIVEKEVTAFQPFFADEDLPQFLTAGDEIDLPVIVRNFLPRPEPVNVSLAVQPWLAMLGPSVQKIDAAANGSVRLSFPIRAQTPTSDGGIRVAAVGKSTSDAIERKATVRPFGEEQVATDSQILNNSSVLTLSIPQTALPGSINAELKVYPNLMAHVWEGIDAILERPWGCGEQAISSTYPSILLLQYAKRAGRENSLEVAKARRFAQLGYDRLLSYQTAGGGFSYWGRGDAADLSLTAYALMFLRDAKQVIPVDEQVSRHAQRWLLSQMKPDGHWPAQYYWNTQKEDTSRSAIVTAYIARVLASREPVDSNDSEGQQLTQQTERGVAEALDWLAPRSHQVDEPYLIASYALALFETGNAENRKLGLAALEQLKSLTRHEESTNYWSLETNTPFYGWGQAGVLETTALVLQAFEQAPGNTPDANRALVDGGILYLLRNQDQFGIWDTTQATVNVLDAMAESVVPTSAVTAANVGSSANVLVDGKAVAKIALPPADELRAPVSTDVSKFLGPGNHRIEVTRAPGQPKASAQLAATYYIPWTQYSTSEALRHKRDSAEALRLSVKYDKNNASVGEAITCTVNAERVDFRGYGMMLAEIGLPPGAEVDRASLEKAMNDSGWTVDQFDVLPDRVILYLWPHAGGTSFSFSFTARFGFDAETTPSILYDYYNPDARAVVMPTRLIVR